MTFTPIFLERYSKLAEKAAIEIKVIGDAHLQIVGMAPSLHNMIVTVGSVFKAAPSKTTAELLIEAAGESTTKAKEFIRAAESQVHKVFGLQIDSAERTYVKSLIQFAKDAIIVSLRKGSVAYTETLAKSLASLARTAKSKKLDKLYDETQNSDLLNPKPLLECAQCSMATRFYSEYKTFQDVRGKVRDLT